MVRCIVVALLLLTKLSIAAAQPVSEGDIPVRCTSWQMAYDVNADGSYVENQKWSMVVLKENAVEEMKQSSITFSTSVAKGEILEAYTLKKSGRRIDAPKSSYQVSRNDGYDSASPFYSDETSISVIFPELAVGDTVVFSYRITNSEGIFPGHFSVAHSFSPFRAYDDVRLRITAPATMKLRRESYFVAQEQPVVKEGRQILEWSYRNKTPEKWTPAQGEILAVGDEPSVFVSTFDSYRQIVEAYGARATPKAAVTERISTLASQIVGSRSTPEAQARAIYDWVARNISYGGNCIGVGAVVPRDLDVVLDNRLGDCKDHATLLQALLAARQIPSEQALINAEELYDLPKVPVVSAVNHVINYLPDQQLFVDSTSAQVPFGMLPIQLGEKPVLLVSHFREGAKTPSMAQYGHQQIMRTTVHINEDGSATGSARIILKGLPAISAREAMRHLTGDQEEYAVRRILETQGMHGTGKLQMDDPSDLLDEYSYSMSFHLQDLLMLASTTGMPIRPIVSSFQPIELFGVGAYDPVPTRPTTCNGGRSVEEYLYEFPKSQTIVGFPKDYDFSSPTLEYRATYRKSGNTLTVRREVHDKTPSNICSTRFTEEYRKSARTILRDIRSQVLISN